MKANSQPETARIYPFPARGNAKPETRSERPASVVSLAVRRMPDIAGGAAWYHEEAMREAERDRRQ